MNPIPTIVYMLLLVDLPHTLIHPQPLTHPPGVLVQGLLISWTHSLISNKGTGAVKTQRRVAEGPTPLKYISLVLLLV